VELHSEDHIPIGVLITLVITFQLQDGGYKKRDRKYIQFLINNMKFIK